MSLLVIHNPNVPIESFRRIFAQSGCQITSCPNHQVAKTLLERHPFKALFFLHPSSQELLLEAYAELQQFGLPTFVTSRRQSGIDRVNALHAGITNYYIEPFSYTQMVQEAVSVLYSPKTESKSVVYGDIKIDFLTRTVTIPGRELFLSKIQFPLFCLFVQNPRQVFSRVQIWEHVWGYSDYPLTNTIDAQIRRLRLLLPSEIAKRIEAVHGVGYRYIPVP